eukprot:CAMPEP_0178442452 /NCGR_PEP_ID=MMETSP0689_2-20121128/38172_1 /TAXON_ID=160604 /ORGANISM="Amphidinium massartii, Strain CS-259" /LENGTH=267 /DNA_ID=CAMNT_0020065999 /DNA_START=168 /DNA_END=971 /DNA_ORIENTATION=+
MRSSCESSVAGADMSIQQFVTSKKAQKWIYLNADKSQSCLVNTDEIQWIETAANGVKRKMIERLGGEVARATTVVQFGANASFPEHEHEGGEEFIVLAGDWIDDWATQPKNTYVRNYIGSRHTPRMGPEGVTILVKLCQMSEKHPEPEHTQWDISEANPDWKECTDIKGRRLLHVFKSPNEEVRFERWMPGAQGTVPVPALGEEVFVLEGSFSDGMGEHRKWSWARNSGEVSEHVRKAGAEGCFLYVKSKHLKSPEVDLEALCLKRQ